MSDIVGVAYNSFLSKVVLVVHPAIAINIKTS